MLIITDKIVTKTMPRPLHGTIEQIEKLLQINEFSLQSVTYLSVVELLDGSATSETFNKLERLSCRYACVFILTVKDVTINVYEHASFVITDKED